MLLEAKYITSLEALFHNIFLHRINSGGPDLICPVPFLRLPLGVQAISGKSSGMLRGYGFTTRHYRHHGCIVCLVSSSPSPSSLSYLFFSSSWYHCSCKLFLLFSYSCCWYSSYPWCSSLRDGCNLELISPLDGDFDSSSSFTVYDALVLAVLSDVSCCCYCCSCSRDCVGGFSCGPYCCSALCTFLPLWRLVVFNFGTSKLIAEFHSFRRPWNRGTAGTQTTLTQNSPHPWFHIQPTSRHYPSTPGPAVFQGPRSLENGFHNDCVAMTSREQLFEGRLPFLCDVLRNGEKIPTATLQDWCLEIMESKATS